MHTDKLLVSTGNSMYPLLLNNDLIILNHSNKIDVDDIVTVEKKSLYVTHRVIYVDKFKDQVITKGDNNPLPDEPVKLNEISGKVQKVIRNGKTLNIESLYLFQSAFYLEEIKKINSLFLKQNIPFVFLKGLPVYLYYTKNPPRRIYADCDILIDPQFYNRVKDILLSLGYKKENSSLNSFLDKFSKSKPEITYSKNIKNFRISFDIHLEAVFLMVQTNNLSPLYPKILVKKFSKLLISQKRIVIFNKDKFPLLTTENQIVYLALHLFHDNFKGYYKYLLLEKVINSSLFSEEQIINIVREYKFENFVYPVFKLLLRYYHPKLSKSFLKNIRPQQKQTVKQINHIVHKIDIFQDQGRISSGISRFRNIYCLSPAKPILKPLVFLKHTVMILILFALIRKLESALKSSFIHLAARFVK